RRGERVTVDVALHVTGEPAPGALVTAEFQSLSIEVEATSIPGQVEVDMTGAAVGTQILAGSVRLPGGAVLVTDPETLVLNVVDAQRSAEPEEELAAEPEPATASV